MVGKSVFAAWAVVQEVFGGRCSQVRQDMPRREARAKDRQSGCSASGRTTTWQGVVGKAVEGQGNAVVRQRKVKERRWTRRWRTKWKGSGKAKTRQWKVKERQLKSQGRAVEKGSEMQRKGSDQAVQTQEKAGCDRARQRNRRKGQAAVQGALEEEAGRQRGSRREAE